MMERQLNIAVVAHGPRGCGKTTAISEIKMALGKRWDIVHNRELLQGQEETHELHLVRRMTEMG